MRTSIPQFPYFDNRVRQAVFTPEDKLLIDRIFTVDSAEWTRLFDKFISDMKTAVDAESGLNTYRCIAPALVIRRGQLVKAGTLKDVRKFEDLTKTLYDVSDNLLKRFASKKREEAFIRAVAAEAAMLERQFEAVTPVSVPQMVYQQGPSLLGSFFGAIFRTSHAYNKMDTTTGLPSTSLIDEMVKTKVGYDLYMR